MTSERRAEGRVHSPDRRRILQGLAGVALAQVYQSEIETIANRQLTPTEILEWHYKRAQKR